MTARVGWGGDGNLSGSGQIGNVVRGCCWSEPGFETGLFIGIAQLDLRSGAWSAHEYCLLAVSLRARERWNLIVTRPGNDSTVVLVKPG
jgi:hypothetical protein